MVATRRKTEARKTTNTERRRFTPGRGPGEGYRLPPGVADRLSVALAPFRNREAAFLLAWFLCRYHTAPGVLGRAFNVDRRSLSRHGLLELTENRIRGAIRTLKRVGFLEPCIPLSRARHRLVEVNGERELHRKPVFYHLAADYRASFKGGRRQAPPRPRDTRAQPMKSPKSAATTRPVEHMGEKIGLPPRISTLHSRDRRASEDLQRAIGRAEALWRARERPDS